MNALACGPVELAWQEDNERYYARVGGLALAVEKAMACDDISSEDPSQHTYIVKWHAFISGVCGLGVVEEYRRQVHVKFWMDSPKDAAKEVAAYLKGMREGLEGF